MIDYGLLISVMIALGLPSIVGIWWTIWGDGAPVGFLDVALGPAFAGLVLGRLTALALDDPSSIGSVPDMLIIRSGVEFWPGVAAAIVTVLLSAHFSRISRPRRMSELAPLAMLAYSGYELACVFRDGCYGPNSVIGLSPPGLTTTMLPVGWMMAAGVGLAAFGIHVLVRRAHSPMLVALVSIGVVASARAIGSIWLPHVGDGLTRQHLSSIVIAVMSLTAVAVLVTVAPRRRLTESARLA